MTSSFMRIIFIIIWEVNKIDLLSVGIVWAVGLYFLVQLWKMFGEDIKNIYNFFSGFRSGNNTKKKNKKKKKSVKDIIRDSFDKDN